MHWAIPVPLDDFDWGHDFDHDVFAVRALDVSIHDGSQLQGSSWLQGVAGDMRPNTLRPHTFPTRPFVAGDMQHSDQFQWQFDPNTSFATSHAHSNLDDGGRTCRAVIGGTAPQEECDQALPENVKMNQNVLYNFATTTDLLMQNLTMVVGNPSQRCFANAPWRAFTWLCAFLQEDNLQPWGTIRDAVQESLNL